MDACAHGIDIHHDVHGDADRGSVLLIGGTGQPVAVWSLLGIIEHDPIFPPSGQRDVAAAVPNASYVEIAGVSHVGMDPVSVTATLDALVDFVSAH